MDSKWSREGSSSHKSDSQGSQEIGAARPTRIGQVKRTLSTKRTSDGMDLIYGRNAVREALRGRRKVHSVLIAQGEKRQSLEQALRTWCANFNRELPPIAFTSASELTARLGTTEHQGMAAVVDPYEYVNPEEVLRGFSLLVALDQVQDPQNLGAIIRTAEAAGAAVIIPRHRATEVTPAVVKASAGATEHATVAQVRNLSDFLAEARSAGFWVYGAEPGAADIYSDQDYAYPTCFVLGSEGEGLGRRVASFCDVLISVPLLGQVNSLNVSVCAAILLFEAVRQRRKST
ncbi:MAG: 23S rRNA (guanosine(2251)-2'-O)-methyltransferase RlmB [Thermoleophilia bacterium]|nr:23S rRNA (guanosine(2251)-2'-O)-methyltransferase RlmB [Thermoleophilia bacterium]